MELLSDTSRSPQAEHPRITVHYTPTHASCLNMVEIVFGIAERKAIRRGSFTSVTELRYAIRRFITSYNQTAKPFKWIKTADEILHKALPKPTSDTQHWLGAATIADCPT
ncbi:MAG: hypothetical protein ACOYEV_13970 [Candidatus Nanopelagicales bacterium]